MRLCLLVLVVQFAVAVHHAAPFENLGFDNADTNNAFVPGSRPLQGSTPDFLPGWNLVSGANPITFVSIDLAHTGLNLAILYSTNIYSSGLGLNPPVEDRYSLNLVPDFNIEQSRSIPFSMEQSGDIPNGASLIHFTSYGTGRFALSLNDVSVPLVYVPRSANFSEVYDAYGDISTFAGLTTALTLSIVPSDRFSTQYGIDSISFIVPEPSVVALFFIGIVGLLRFRRQF